MIALRVADMLVKVADYVNALLGIAQRRERRLYLHTISVVLNVASRMIQEFTEENLPRGITTDCSINLLFKLFIPLIDDYLYEELQYVKDTCKKLIDDWVSWIHNGEIRQEQDGLMIS